MPDRVEHWAHSVVEIKSLDEEKRILTGVATNPTPDKLGDVVVPTGAQFKLPLPFLYHHDSTKPVGHVTKAKVTEKGIEVEVKIKKIDEPGRVKDRVDEAWHDIKYGLVRGFSIGFKEIEAEPIKDTFGLKFLKWLWLELSAVTITAGMGTDIQTVKSLAAEQMAASGRSVSKTTAASGDKQKSIARSRSMAQKKTLADQIADWKETLKAKSERQDEILEDAEGQTLDEAQSEEYDGLTQEIDGIKGHIKRLKDRMAAQVETAKPVDEAKGSESASAVRGGAVIHAQAKGPKPEPGIRLARFARCLGMANKSHRDVMSVADEQYGQRDPEVVGMIKAAVIASNTTTDAAMIGNVGGWADFVEFLRPQTILGRFGTAGVPGVRRVPFRVPLITQSGAGTGYWVGEGKAKPLTKPAFTRTTLDPLKVANIAVATMEQLRDSSPSAEMLIRDDLAAALVVRMDTSFIDPSNSGTGGVEPASITDGIVAIPSSGGTAAAVRDDVRAAMAAFVAANNPLTSGVWIMSASTALGLQLMVNELTSTPEFPGITVNGGTFFGLPVITSEHISDYVVLVNAGDIYFADEGGITIDMSTEASLEMMDNPTGDSVASTPVAAELVSLWQTNSVGFRAERTVNWMRRRASGVAVISGVAWGVPAS